MSIRPYPSADRALNQIARHYPDPPAPVRYVIGLGRDVGNIRAMTEDEAAGLTAGTYVLSTRRPGVVSGQP